MGGGALAPPPRPLPGYATASRDVFREGDIVPCPLPLGHATKQKMQNMR